MPGIGKSEAELLVMVERLQAELRTFRSENDMRTSQYIRAISRLTIMDDQAPRFALATTPYFT